MFTFLHSCVTVKDIDKSILFYHRALGLTVKRRKENPNIKLVYMGDEANSTFELELTWKPGHDNGWELGENPTHIAFVTDNFQESLELHRQMCCIKAELPAMGIYFISDPDGYTIEILPKGHPTMQR